MLETSPPAVLQRNWIINGWVHSRSSKYSLALQSSSNSQPENRVSIPLSLSVMSENIPPMNYLNAHTPRAQAPLSLATMKNMKLNRYSTPSLFENAYITSSSGKVTLPWITLGFYPMTSRTPPTSYPNSTLDIPKLLLHAHPYPLRDVVV